MDIAVSEEKLSQAIGGWPEHPSTSQLTVDLNVMSRIRRRGEERDASQGASAEFHEAARRRRGRATILAQGGFLHHRGIAYVPQRSWPPSRVRRGIVKELRNRARDMLLTQAIASRRRSTIVPADDLLLLEGMTRSGADAGAAPACVPGGFAEQSVVSWPESKGWRPTRRPRSS